MIRGLEILDDNCYRLSLRNTNPHKGIMFNRAVIRFDSNEVLEMTVHLTDPRTGYVMPWDGFLSVDALDVIGENYLFHPQKNRDRLKSLSKRTGDLILYNGSKKVSYPYKITLP